ncbi:MAG: conjugal transfer protein TraF [Planctomycetota bacterium]|jgi:thioredoxin 1|nr:conjugal transfer protein TraF [Planctomycetota bacterium]
MPGKVRELTNATFNDAVSAGVALVDFWAAWCPPCRRQGPIVEGLADAYAGRALIAKMDVDQNGETAARFGVNNIPTIILLKDGKEERRLVGVTESNELAGELDKLL